MSSDSSDSSLEQDLRDAPHLRGLVSDNPSDVCAACGHPVRAHRFSLAWRTYVCQAEGCDCAQFDPETNQTSRKDRPS